MTEQDNTIAEASPMIVFFIDGEQVGTLDTLAQDKANNPSLADLPFADLACPDQVFGKLINKEVLMSILQSDANSEDWFNAENVEQFGDHKKIEEFLSDNDYKWVDPSSNPMYPYDPEQNAYSLYKSNTKDGKIVSTAGRTLVVDPNYIDIRQNVHVRGGGSYGIAVLIPRKP